MLLIIMSVMVLLTHGYWGVWLFLSNGMLNNMGVIGGTDGPTQIFVSTTADGQMREMVTAGILLIMGVIGFVKLSHCHKKQE